jgi:hypothetical protein
MKRAISTGTAGIVAALGVFFAVAGGLSSAQVAPSLPTITVALTGSSISVGGALQSGAVDIRSTTTVVKDAEPTFVRLNPGVTVAQALAFAATPAAADLNNVTRKLGAVVFDADAPQGTSDVQTTLQPGDYLALDTQGSNPAKFPYTEFTITQAAAPATLPAPAATVTSIDFGFRGPTTLHTGELVRFQNDGFVSHMIVAVKVKNVATARKAMALLRAGSRAAQRLALGFASFLGPVSPGYGQQLVVRAAPGVYVLVCFEDTQDHRGHAQIGMVRLIRILK